MARSDWWAISMVRPSGGGPPLLDGGPRLAQETGPQLLVVHQLLAHQLDDADLVEQAVAHLVDRAHAALADLLQDLVLPFDALERNGGRHGETL